MSGQDLEFPSLCCNENVVEGERGSRDSKKGRKGWSKAFRSPAGP